MRPSTNAFSSSRSNDRFAQLSMKRVLVGIAILTLGLLATPASAAFVSGTYPSVLNRFNDTTGEFEYSVRLLHSATGLTFGPDGLLYAAIRDEGRILKFDPETGSNLGVFTSEAGWCNSMAFMPNGDMLVANFQDHNILRFDGITGASKGTFAAGGGLEGPIDLKFGPDGDLFVTSTFNHQVIRYDGTTGAFESTFVDGDGLNRPFNLLFDPNGDLLVSSALGHDVRRYDGTTGNFKDVFASGSGLNDPSDLAFGPDGDLYVVSASLDEVFRFDGESGAFEGTCFSTNRPQAIAFEPVPEPSTVVLLMLASLILPRSR